MNTLSLLTVDRPYVWSKQTLSWCRLLCSLSLFSEQRVLKPSEYLGRGGQCQMCLNTASNFRRMIQLTYRGSKMTGFVSTQIIRCISFLIVCSVTTIFQDIGRSSWHWGKSSSQQLLSVLYSVLEEELPRAPTLSLYLQEAETQPPCHSAFWHRATWLSATEPGFLQLLSWVDKARFPQQLSWCVYTAAFLTAPCAELATPFSLLSPFPRSFWGCCGRACSGMGLSIWPRWNLMLCITETFLWLVFFPRDTESNQHSKALLPSLGVNSLKICCHACFPEADN